MSFYDILRAFAGLILVLFGLVISVGSLLTWDDSDIGMIGKVGATVGLGLLPLGVGCGLWFWAWRSQRRRAGEAAERVILLLAKDKGGTLSAQILALETDFTLQEAETALKRCFEAGHCTLDFGPGGVPVYLFSHLASDPS